MIERIAALTYEAKNRRRPVRLEAADVEAALNAIVAVRRSARPTPGTSEAT